MPVAGGAATAEVAGGSEGGENFVQERVFHRGGVGESNLTSQMCAGGESFDVEADWAVGILGWRG
ncbi:hypothetical protein, partial [Gordonia effusa]|uniref:hypothetical protein n=1 Tax=Gordonia effusa TaxID=263908 RepID=UPI00058DB0D1